MEDQRQAAERGGRLDDLPAHEDDSDVAGTVGGGIMGMGGTATDRGTGELGGVAQGEDAGSMDAGADEGDTPGILDFTDPQHSADDGAAGTRDRALNLDDEERPA